MKKAYFKPTGSNTMTNTDYKFGIVGALTGAAHMVARSVAKGSLDAKTLPLLQEKKILG